MSSTYCADGEYQKYSVGQVLSGNVVKLKKRTLDQTDKLEFTEVGNEIPSTDENIMDQFPSREEIERRIKSNMVASKVEVRIKVRYIIGEMEHATSLVFSINDVKAKHICAAMKVKLGLKLGEASLFSLWIIGKDLEYQIPPDADVLKIQRNWIKYLAKYTHSSPAIIGSNNPEVVGHILQYRKCALQTVAVEQRFKSMKVIDLMYGEAKFNIIKERYPCSLKDAAILAGLILCSYLGPYNPDRHVVGYIKCGLYNYILPKAVSRAMPPAKWEEILQKSHERFSNLSLYQVRIHFVSYVRRWLCYGASYFPVCAQKPASKFFEHRSQMWYIGVNVMGLFIFDSYNYVHIFSASWYSVLRVGYSTDTIWFYFKKNKANSKSEKKFKKSNVMKLYSPQAPLIYNLVLKCRTMHILDSTLARNDIVKAYPDQVKQLPNIFLHSIKKSEESNKGECQEVSENSTNLQSYDKCSSEKKSPQNESPLRKSRVIPGKSSTGNLPLSSLGLDSKEKEATNPKPKIQNPSKNKNHENKDDKTKRKSILKTTFGKKSDRPKYDLFYPKWPSMDTHNEIAVPRLQKGPVKVPKKDIYCKFRCDMASPNKNFRHLASTSVMNVHDPSVSRNQLL